MDFSASAETIAALYERLRSEKLMVSSEQEILKKLNQDLKEELDSLEEQIWVCRQEKSVLKRLVTSDRHVRPEFCGQLLAAIQAAKFTVAHRSLGHNASTVTEVLKLCLYNPRCLAELLNGVEVNMAKNQTITTIDDVCKVLFNVLFGASVFPADEKRLLEFLAHLISLQLISKPDPRRAIRKGSSAFCKMYSLFSEQLVSAKIFLTAALHEPIMSLLSQDEMFLDIDPSKSPIRLTADEKKRRFGTDENSVQYKEKVAAYRRTVVEKLFKLSSLFVKSIQQAITCFPSSLIWLVRQLRTSLLDKKRVTKEEAQLICTDLIFTNFICPAIINPEPNGVISDTPISYMARFNLMQIGQVIQTLALIQHEEPPPYMNGLLHLFSDNPMKDFVKNLLKLEVSSLETMYPDTIKDDEGNELFARRNFIGSVADIQLLIEFIKSLAIDVITDESTKKDIKQLTKRLPEDLVTLSPVNGDLTSVNGTPKSLMPRSSSGRLRVLADKVQLAAKTQHQKLMTNLPGNNVSTNNAVEEKQELMVIEPPQVLVFEISSGFTPLGMIPEEKIMDQANKTNSARKGEKATEKKTRFKATESVVSDRTGTTDAPSDDDEEDDEAEGVGSLCSSMNMNDEDDDPDDDVEEDVSTLPDNFSDVVPISANVSGRGSPSLSGGRASGRGTPFSGNGAPEPSISSTAPIIDFSAHYEPPRNLPRLPVTVRKQNPEGLEEKFGKFGLPPQDPSRYRDETYSLVSDSWSTDVVASDNEGLSDQQQRSEQLSAPLPPPIPPRLHESQSSGQIVDIGLNQLPGISGTNPIISQPNPIAQTLSDRERIADDILNKYRLPVGPSPSTTSSNLYARSLERKDEEPLDQEPLEPYYDPNNLTKCKAFTDVKRKLRLVLSSVGNCSSAVLSSRSLINGADSSINNLNEFLKYLLAESINNHDWMLSAQIREVQRCLSMFDNRGIRKLLRSLKDEHRRRTSYLMYLQQSRSGLLQLNSYLSKLLARIQREKSLISDCLIEFLVRFYLERKEKFVRRFVFDFARLKVQDERTYVVDRTLSAIYDQMHTEPIWKDFSENNMEYVRKSLDRALMAQVYSSAMYPNAEADVLRDDVLCKSLRVIAPSITPEHSELRIPRRFHGECPWPSAQAEISIINAYKSPKDKLTCVMRCCQTIESLCRLSSGRSATSADDITPVLVYVLLQANPSSLLSNIQYINGFYSNRLQGEEAYWWTQFHAAVEFLKTLCNKH